MGAEEKGYSRDPGKQRGDRGKLSVIRFLSLREAMEDHCDRPKRKESFNSLEAAEWQK